MARKCRLLITGGAGSVGRHWTSALLEEGHEVRVLDRDVEPLKGVVHENLTLTRGGVEDRDILESAVQGVDAVLHLAWSFSGDPLEILEKDLKGHVYLLEECVRQNVRHLIYTSTAVVYGKPRYSPIDEEHPLLVEEARKPLYGISKAAAEKLCLMYWKERGLPVTVMRFWWAFGKDIAGKHLREMLKTAAAGGPIEVPGESGGSFVAMDDLAKGMELCLFNPKAYGRTFNFSTVYVSWEEVAHMVRDATGSGCEVRSVPRDQWAGSAFLADPWDLSDAAARDLLGYRPTEASLAKASLAQAIERTWRDMTRGGQDT
ncbi:MAG: NAD(P)-dependent oxidoreductase [bacterium]|nr:MAG: NAD(P)-dependent oxidoreductase [bacterium]